MRFYIFFAVLFSCAFFIGTANALNMQEAITKATEYSAKISAQASTTSAARFYKYSTYAGFLPNLSAGYTFSHNAPSLSPTYSLNSLNITANMNVFRGFSDYLNFAEARQNLARQNLSLSSVKADIILSTKLAYIKVLQNRALLATASESAKLLEGQLKKADSFYQQGLRAKNEVLTMQLQLSNANITLESAKMNLNYALAELSNLLGISINDDEVSEIDSIDLIEYNKDNLLSLALNNNPDYLSQKSRLESANIEFRRAKGAFLPQVDLVGVKYWYIDGAGQASANYGLQSQVRLNVSLNLFNGLKDGFSYQVKRYDVLASKSTLSQYERNLELSLESLLRDYQNAKHQFQIAQDSLQKAKENYQIINNRYLQNLSTYTELINAQLLLTTMQTSINQARYNLISIQANIERLSNP